ncbi:MAG TPA: ATP-binding protein [Planctomycetota bacterium]
MASIFIFLVLVFGLLTLNLWLDAAARSRAEAQRNALLIGRLVSDLARSWTSRYPDWTEEAWAELSRKLELTDILERWTVVGFRDDKPVVMASNELDPEIDVESFREALAGVPEPDGSRIYMPLDTPSGERFVARLDLRGPAVPHRGLSGAMGAIVTVMALGTVLLLLNLYVVTNRLVLRPLESLVDASGRVARGDFSQKIASEGRYDEMGRMIQAFNLMLDKIADHRRTLEDDVRQARGKVANTERRLFAAQRLTTTGTLAAGIAHEINNPLGGMINAVRALEEGRLDEAKRAEYLGLVSEGLGRVRAIVQRMLQFGPRTFEPKPSSLREAVDSAAAFLSHTFKAKDVALQVELPADLPAVNGNPVELQQAFLNVLKNAVDACVMGEGVVTVYHRAGEGDVSVMVADNGCGMDEGERARCLDPFFTTKDVGEGTGLGLAVANNIVANHGGKIEIHSDLGKGTTVTLTFPTTGAGVEQGNVSA